MTFNVLITCVGGELGPQVVLFLRNSQRHTVRVIGVDASENASGRHFVDEFAVVPRGTDPGYVDAIEELVRRHEINLVMPSSDEEALALAAQRERLERNGAQVSCVDIETLEVLADKVRCYRRQKDLGLHLPFWREAQNRDDLIEFVKQANAEYGDVVIKPAADRGGRGVCVITDAAKGVEAYHGGREYHMDKASFLDDIDSYAARFPMIVMERLMEPVFDVDMLAWQGAPIRVVPRRRVDSALPNEGHTIVGNADLIELGNRLVEGFGLSWLYDCDVMYDSQNRPCILEVNPRPSGSMSVTVAAGVPLIDDVISLAKGETIPDIAVPMDRVVVPYKAVRMLPKPH